MHSGVAGWLSHLPTEISLMCEQLVPTDILRQNLLYIFKKALCRNIYFDQGKRLVVFM